MGSSTSARRRHHTRGLRGAGDRCACNCPPEDGRPPTSPSIAGHDEHGKICTEARDDIFTAMHAGSCVRFDLAVNTFCGGEVSGARDMTDRELENIHARMESILATVRFTGPKK